MIHQTRKLTRVLQKRAQTAIIRFQETGMVNYILLYKIRSMVKRIIKDKIADDEIATTPKSCIGCLADDISWEVYYLLKEKEEKDGPPASEG
jgi:DNA repair protein RadC